MTSNAVIASEEAEAAATGAPAGRGRRGRGVTYSLTGGRGGRGGYYGCVVLLCCLY